MCLKAKIRCIVIIKYASLVPHKVKIWIKTGQHVACLIKHWEREVPPHAQICHGKSEKQM